MRTSLVWQGLVAMVVLGITVYALVVYSPRRETATGPVDPTPKEATITGTYGCLPHANTSGPQTEECAFGIKTDNGVWYAVNFGQSADAMQQFQSGSHVTLHGFVVLKEAPNTDHWMIYDMEGIFTATGPAMPPGPATPQGKIDIHAVCQGALSYMTFADAAASDAFIQACIRGEHPEVVERFKAQLDVGDDASI